MQIALTVDGVLRESHRRRKDRRALIRGMDEETLRFRMDDLRAVMFDRKTEDEAFHPLREEELAILEHHVRGYIQDKRFLVGHNGFVAKHYETIRHNLLCGDHAVGPDEFRSASAEITKGLISRGVGKFDIWAPSSTIILPWRAGLAFADAAIDGGFSQFYHFGACRNEQTLATEIYFEDVPVSLERHPEKQTVLIADPMLASGNTTIAALHRLKELGVPQERTFVICVISSPEGIDHILQAYPAVRIFAGRHDEYLNDRGYIVPGLGDYGDWFFEGLGWGAAAAWQSRGILNDGASDALLARMAA